MQLPVLAPEGTAARNSPKSVTRSTSTVGFPRESKICLAKILLIGILEASENARWK